MNSSKTPILFLMLGILLSLAAMVLWSVRSRQMEQAAQQGELPVAGGAPVAGVDPGDAADSTVDPVVINPKDDGGVRMLSSPEVLMAEMVRRLEDDDMSGFSDLVGGAIDDESMRRLEALIAQQRAKGHPMRVREVGELELNQRSRWAIDFGDGSEVGSLMLDLKRDGDKWSVDNVKLPIERGADELAEQDALGVAWAFVQAVLGQRFEEAHRHVQAGSVSDTRIVGLCILFEEGKYQMREEKPLRAMFQRDDVAGFMASVVTEDHEPVGQFGLTLVKEGAAKRWLVSEVNLDRLLADYAGRVAAGDVYYSPLVKNPKSGETLALYFEFDEDEISPRTRRQLEIVAAILRSDPVKKLTLSGHTDAKGSDDYNRSLSLRRAEAVRDFLVEAGVEAKQVELLAMGSTQPRRPNVTETGADNPQGRRANRRTEIYLDF